MYKSFKSLLLFILLLFILNPSFALDFDEMYENGVRAYKMSRWEESVEFFDRLLDLWPNNSRNSEILYYRALSIIKGLEDSAFNYKLELLKDATKDIENIFLDHPDFDLSELKAAEELFKQGGKPLDWQLFNHIKPEDLKHILLREWHPSPLKYPMETLLWLNTYSSPEITPTVRSLLKLVKVKALWQMLLSPLVAAQWEKELKELELWPVSDAFEKCLNRGFRMAEPAVKREFALFGFHYDHFKNGLLDKKQSYNKSKWLKYLQQRGLVSKEALCPY